MMSAYGWYDGKTRKDLDGIPPYRCEACLFQGMPPLAYINRLSWQIERSIRIGSLTPS